MQSDQNPTGHEPFGPEVDSRVGAHAGVGAESGADAGAGAEPSVYKMRCPQCQKLYSVQGEAMRSAAAPLRFQCQDCHMRFGAQLTSMNGAIEVQTFGIAPEPVPLPPLPPPIPQIDLPEPTLDLDFIDGEPAFNREARDVRDLPLPSATEMRCPKCGTRNSSKADECCSCGIVFAKYKPNTDSKEYSEITFSGRRELAEMWEAVMADYNNRELHEQFVLACYEASCLPFASQKYARLLSVTPHEEIAKSMRHRIVALASHRLEVAPEAGLWKFRVPALNQLVMALAGALIVMGLMIPSMKSLSGVGFAALALAIGVRWFLRPQR